jgi:hypothetical protein
MISKNKILNIVLISLFLLASCGAISAADDVSAPGIVNIHNTDDIFQGGSANEWGLFGYTCLSYGIGSYAHSNATVVVHDLKNTDFHIIDRLKIAPGRGREERPVVYQQGFDSLIPGYLPDLGYLTDITISLVEGNGDTPSTIVRELTYSFDYNEYTGGDEGYNVPRPFGHY